MVGNETLAERQTRMKDRQRQRKYNRMAGLPESTVDRPEGRPSWDEVAQTISHLIVGGFEFKGEDVRQLRSSVVYVATGIEGLVYYVGRSHRGMARASEHNHHVISGEILERLYTLKVYTCATPEAADRLESELIYWLQPQFNQVHP